MRLLLVAIVVATSLIGGIVSRARAAPLTLLYACIEPSIGSNEFFLRKAIGWALRRYAWTYPAKISRYVERNADRLSGLSRSALRST